MYSDYHAISNLAYTYTETMDAADHAGLALLFSHAEVYLIHEGPGGSGPPITGAENLKAFWDGLVRLYDGKTRCRHCISNFLLEIDDKGETASSRAYFNVFLQTPDIPLQVIASGRYHDEYKKIEGVWYFTKKRIMSDFFGINVTGHTKRLAWQLVEKA
jgi:hypothetical protein